jgi:hypothetical protein
VSVNLTRIGGLEPPETTALTTTNATVVHTASTAFVRAIETIVLCNIDNTNACVVLLSWNDGSTDTTFWNGEVASGETVIIDNIPIMTDGKGRVRSIKATAAAADDINVTVISSAISRQAAPSRSSATPS